jgi:hypothetical protein
MIFLACLKWRYCIENYSDLPELYAFIFTLLNNGLTFDAKKVADFFNVRLGSG